MKSAFESPGIIGIRSGDIGKVCALRAQILYIWPLHASVWEIIFTCTIDSPAAPPRKNFPHFRTTDEMTGKIFYHCSSSLSRGTFFIRMACYSVT